MMGMGTGSMAEGQHVWQGPWQGHGRDHGRDMDRVQGLAEEHRQDVGMELLPEVNVLVLKA